MQPTIAGLKCTINAGYTFYGAQASASYQDRFGAWDFFRVLCQNSALLK